MKKIMILACAALLSAGLYSCDNPERSDTAEGYGAGQIEPERHGEMVDHETAGPVNEALTDTNRNEREARGTTRDVIEPGGTGSTEAQRATEATKQGAGSSTSRGEQNKSKSETTPQR